MPMCGYAQTHMCYKTKCYKMKKLWTMNHMFSACSVRSKAVILLRIIFVIYASRLSFYTVLHVSCSLVIACWERADSLALLCVMLPCVFVTFTLVSRVGCGT